MDPNPDALLPIPADLVASYDNSILYIDDNKKCQQAIHASEAPFKQCTLDYISSHHIEKSVRHDDHQVRHDSLLSRNKCKKQSHEHPSHPKIIWGTSRQSRLWRYELQVPRTISRTDDCSLPVIAITISARYRESKRRHGDLQSCSADISLIGSNNDG